MLLDYLKLILPGLPERAGQFIYYKEDSMLEVSAAATAQLAEYFKDREISPVRIFLNDGGWGGPSLAMALDEPKNTDNNCDIDGFKYIVDKNFMEQVDSINIDFNNYGFKITSGADLGSGCSGCGSAGSC